jgi:TRAP-type mannitol/chloroaromatic compound transport system permease small subunit
MIGRIKPGATILSRLVQPLVRFATIVDALNDGIGRAVAWLMLVVIALLFLQVPLRQLPTGNYAVTSNDIGQLVHAVVFMIGTAYALRWDQHARVDIVYRQMTRRRKAWVNLLGSLLLALPWLWVIGFYSWPIVVNSWAEREVFVDSWAPGYFLLKSMLIAMPALMGLQALAISARALTEIITAEPEAADGAR